MKLIYKLINKNKLFAKLICIGVLFSIYANSAQITVLEPVPAGVVGVNLGNYVYNNTSWNTINATLNTARNTRNIRLNTATLQHHLLSTNNTQGASACIRELSRMLLAQIPNGAGAPLPGPHNVVGNNAPAYTIAVKAGGVGNNCDDIFLACDTLKEHMLIHGHLGYFPFMKNDKKLSKVETFIARGVFNIPFNIASRITNDQRRLARDIFSPRPLTPIQTRNLRAFPYGYNITNDVIHLSPNILADTELPHMFEIDPERRGWPHYPNLNSVANGLINNLLSGNNVVNVQVNQVTGNRFTLNVTYNFANRIPDVTETQNIGYKMDGTITNQIRIVLQVDRGKLSIVTMFPEG